ncbi:EAL domain-containing protein [Aliihoeflea aestuarii]|uniref:EAL domain-containing protein n=1 Tax=Aliihoeflea aestuarii TaxID=453840 RepID=UPI002095DD9A|nr:EAL domain-containing protein [Aliihoeflea aestuarii]MCO6393021.1 EAL domain-containing protein [Aliihoeflea aestuarii]
MTRGLGRSHIEREADGTVVGRWGPYVLRTAFQPIFAFEKGRLRPHAVEALVRPSREGSPLSPNTFFKAIPAADRLSIEALARDLQILNAGISLGADATLFINFDPSLFCDRAIVEAARAEMREVVAEAGLRPGRIVCEVTEQSSASVAALQDFVNALRSDGYRVAVDDYGTESSDMERVKQLRPDIVKFDAKWISRLMETRPGVALLTVMVEEFRQKNILTVFEGIEEVWQIDVAAEVGVSMIQGFALAPPQIARTGSPLAPIDADDPGLPDRDPPTPVGVSEEPAYKRPGRTFGRRGL